MFCTIPDTAPESWAIGCFFCFLLLFLFLPLSEWPCPGSALGFFVDDVGSSKEDVRFLEDFRLLEGVGMRVKGRGSMRENGQESRRIPRDLALFSNARSRRALLKSLEWIERQSTEIYLPLSVKAGSKLLSEGFGATFFQSAYIMCGLGVRCEHQRARSSCVV
jgi:hypothetical protein